MAGYAVLLGDVFQEFAGDDGLPRVFVAPEQSRFPPAFDDVPGEDDIGLVTVEKNPFVAVVFHGDADAVSVGIARHGEVGIYFARFVECHFKGGGLFGVGGCHGREVAVGHHLLRHGGDVGESPVAQGVGHQFVGGAVQGGEYDFQVMLAADGVRGEHERLDDVEVFFIEFLA